jgi:phospholipid transport system substrate-binding protein
VEHFAREVFRGLWDELDESRREAWKSTLQSLLQHRYVERIRDPRRHLLEILSTEVDCHLAKSRVALKSTGRKSQNVLEFHMRLSREGWRVFDVVLEGASLVNSWRSRLNRVHREEGHDGLDKQLHRLMRRYNVER